VAKAISAATLIVLDRNEAALKLAKDLGADHVIQSGESDDFVEKVLDITGGKGAEAVIDFVAEGGSTSTGVKMIRRAGNYYVVCIHSVLLRDQAVILTLLPTGRLW